MQLWLRAGERTDGQSKGEREKEGKMGVTIRRVADNAPLHSLTAGHGRLIAIGGHQLASCHRGSEYGRALQSPPCRGFQSIRRAPLAICQSHSRHIPGAWDRRPESLSSRRQKRRPGDIKVRGQRSEREGESGSLGEKVDCGNMGGGRKRARGRSDGEKRVGECTN